MQGVLGYKGACLMPAPSTSGRVDGHSHWDADACMYVFGRN